MADQNHTLPQKSESIKPPSREVLSEQRTPGHSDMAGARQYGRGAAVVELRHVEIALHEAVASFLNLPVSSVSEGSNADNTNGWDSLSQINIVAHLERVFGVQFAFDDATGATSISELRAALRHLGIVASDDPRSRPVVTPSQNLEESLFGRFVERAQRTPNETFVLFASKGNEHDLTFGWALRHALGTADALRAFPKGSIVAIVLPHSEFLYPSFIGCILAGLIPTFIPPLTPKQDRNVFASEMQILFDRINPCAIITNPEVATSLPDASKAIFAHDIVPCSEDAVSEEIGRLPRVDGRDVAFLQHSSGTTGHKKGVMLSHAKVIDHLGSYGESIGFEPGDKVVSWLPLYHDMGLITSFLMPAIMGGSIVSLSALEWVAAPTSLLRYISRFKGNFCWLPNFAFHHIANADNDLTAWDLGSLKAIISCSEPARKPSFDLFVSKYDKYGCGITKLGVSYAMAETVFAVSQTAVGTEIPAMLRNDQDDIAYLSCGKPLPGVSIEIRNEDGSLVSPGAMGEIFIKSPALFDGYYMLEGLTAERIIDGWYKSRDIGCLRDDALFVFGRLDDVLIVNGRNIVAHEVEDIISLEDGIVPGRVLLCTTHEASAGAERLALLVEPMTDVGDHNALSARLSERVFGICGVRPSYISVLPRGFLIKSTSGKISREKSKNKWLENDKSGDE